MARVFTPEGYLKLKKVTCDKGKHRLRENAYGVTWCVICGCLSTTGGAQRLTEDDKIIIDCRHSPATTEERKEEA